MESAGKNMAVLSKRSMGRKIPAVLCSSGTRSAAIQHCLEDGTGRAFERVNCKGVIGIVPLTDNCEVSSSDSSDLL